MRYRHVKLRFKWWHHDNGPLLAFLKVMGGESSMESQPVVLLPSNKGAFGQEIFDPAKGTSRQLTQKDIDELDEDTLMFYLPYPEQAA